MSILLLTLLGIFMDCLRLSILADDRKRINVIIGMIPQGIHKERPLQVSTTPTLHDVTYTLVYDLYGSMYHLL